MSSGNLPVPTEFDSILVFLKQPVPGLVKTRMARTVGTLRAAELYHQWITTVLENVQECRPTFRIVGAYSGGTVAEFDDWKSLVDQWHPQSDGDLGVRLDNAFSFAFQSARRALAIGTDCLEVSATLIESAFEHLVTHDVVIGPASDGGYYLIGMRRLIPRLFEGVRWSSANTLADQIAVCHRAHLTVSLLEEREDLDTWEDWQRYLARQSARERA